MTPAVTSTIKPLRITDLDQLIESRSKLLEPGVFPSIASGFLILEKSQELKVDYNVYVGHEKASYRPSLIIELTSRSKDFPAHAVFEYSKKNTTLPGLFFKLNEHNLPSPPLKITTPKSILRGTDTEIPIEIAENLLLLESGNDRRIEEVNKYYIAARKVLLGLV